MSSLVVSQLAFTLYPKKADSLDGNVTVEYRPASVTVSTQAGQNNLSWIEPLNSLFAEEDRSSGMEKFIAAKAAQLLIEKNNTAPQYVPPKDAVSADDTASTPAAAENVEVGPVSEVMQAYAGDVVLANLDGQAPAVLLGPDPDQPAVFNPQAEGTVAAARQNNLLNSGAADTVEAIGASAEPEVRDEEAADTEKVFPEPQKTFSEVGQGEPVENPVPLNPQVADALRSVVEGTVAAPQEAAEINTVQTKENFEIEDPDDKPVAAPPITEGVELSISPALEFSGFAAIDEGSRLVVGSPEGLSVKLSMAGIGVAGSRLSVEYALAGSVWHSAGEVSLSEDLSNGSRGAYVKFLLPANLAGEISSLRFRLVYKAPKERLLEVAGQPAVFIDGLWLEAVYAEPDDSLAEADALSDPETQEPEAFSHVDFLSDLLSLSMPSDLSNPITLQSPRSFASTTLQMLIYGVSKQASSTRMGNQITYRDAFSDTDLEYQFSGKQLKENIMLKGRSHPARFNYLLNLEQYDFELANNKLVLFKKGHKGEDLYKLYIISAPIMTDSSGNASQSVLLSMNKNMLSVTPDAEWLETATYPVIVDPTIEISVLNVHSHPVEGQYWNVDFVTVGEADLTITPADQDTVADMQFEKLTCGSEDRTAQAQVLEGDVVFYPNWNCEDVATISHLDLRSGNHHLLFKFNNAEESALSEAFNANIVWNGTGGDANWTNPGNWTGGVAPGSGDVAVFDSSCSSNCSPTINATINVGGISLAAGYAGTITQASGSSVTLGSSGFSQAGGDFVGSNNSSDSITINASFSQSGGNFTAPAGNLNLWRNVAITGGNFVHNSGTLILVSNCCGTPAASFNAPGVTFNKVVINRNDSTLTIAAGTIVPLGDNPSSSINSIGSGGIVNNGTIIISGGIWNISGKNQLITNNGTITHNGSGWVSDGGFVNGPSGNVAYAGSTATFGYDFRVATGTFPSGLTLTLSSVCCGTSPATLDSGSVSFNQVILNRSDGALTIAAGSTVPLGNNPNSTLAGLTNNGTITVSGGVWNISGKNTVITNNGTITHNGSGWVSNGGFVNGSSGIVTYAGSTATIGYDFRVATGTFPSGLTLTLSSVCCGTAAATLDSGSVSFNQVIFNRSDAALTITAGSTVPLGNNPSSVLAGLTNNGTITVTSGTWNISGKNTVITNNGTITHSGSGWVSDGGLVNSSSGTVTYAGSTATFGHDLRVATGTFPSGLTLTIMGNCCGTAAATLDTGNVSFSQVILNRNDGNLTITAGSTIPLGNNPTSNIAGLTNNGTITVSGGTWTANGIVNIANNGTINHNGTGWVSQGGLINGSSGAVTYSGTTASFYLDLNVATGTFPSGLNVSFYGPCCGGKPTTFTPGSVTFGGLTIHKEGNNFAIANGFTVTGNLTITSGNVPNPSVPATIILQGNLTQAGATFGGSNLTLSLEGPATSTVSRTAGTFSSVLNINKSGDARAQLSSAFTTTGQPCTVQAGNLDLNGNNFTCGGTFTVNSGSTLTLMGSEAAVTAPVLNSNSTVLYKGNGNGSSDILSQFKNWSYQNLSIAATDAGDTIDASSVSPLNIPGNLTLASGQLSGPATINVTGNVLGSGGGVSSGNVVLNGSSQQILGTMTFADLTKNVNSADTLTFGNGGTVTITGNMDLQGASGQLLSLRSDLPGTQWNLTPQGSRTIRYLDVQDSNNLGATILTKDLNITNSGNNTNWGFAYLTQSGNRWYGNADNIQPAVAIGGLSATTTIISTSSPVRLRMGLLVTNDALATSTAAFKLQVATSTTGGWLDVTPPGGAPADWWHVSWPRRAAVSVYNSVSNSIPNYQIKLAVAYDSDMQPTFDDLRFVNALGTELSFWKESFSTSSAATFWVKVPSVAASATTTFYMYYGNSSASATGSIQSTFRNGEIYLETRRCLDGTNCNFTDNHTEFDNIINANYQLDGSGYVNAVSNADNPYGSSDQYFSRYRFLFLATTTGSYGFGVNTDDAGEAHLRDAGDADTSHTVLASWYGGHGTGSCGGSGTLGSATFIAGNAYWLEHRHSEWQQGNQAQMCIRAPAGSYQTASVSAFPGQIFARTMVQAEPTASVVSGSEEVMSSAWIFHNNPSVASGTSVSSLLLPASSVQGSYMESNPTALNPFAAGNGQYIEYDFALDPAGILLNTDYYFRLVRSDGVLLDTYGDYPVIRLATDNPPAVPSSLGPSGLTSGNWVNTSTPSFTFDLSDPDVADQVSYQIQISTTSDFSSLAVDYTSGLQPQGSATFTPASSLPDSSEYYWRVLTQDQYFVSSGFATATVGSAAFRVDTTAPVAGSISLGGVSTSTITVSVSGASDSLSGLAAVPYVFTNQTSGISSTATTSVDYEFSGLTPNTRYVFLSTVSDQAGNSGDTATSAAYTLASVPTGTAAVADSQTQITLSWSANGNPTGTEYYAVNLTASTTSGWLAATSSVFSGLTCNTTYSFSVKARNGDGAETATTSGISQATASCSNNQGGGGGGGGGGALPEVSGSAVLINGNASVTTSSLVTLSLMAESATRMSISNSPDFASAVQEPFAASKSWNLCSSTDCPDGVYKVYVKYYASSGKESQVVFDDVTLKAGSSTPAVLPPPLVLLASLDHKSWYTALDNIPAGKNVSLQAVLPGDLVAKETVAYFDCDNDGNYEKTVKSVHNTSVIVRNLCKYSRAGAVVAAVKVAYGSEAHSQTVPLMVGESFPPVLPPVIPPVIPPVTSTPPVIAPPIPPPVEVVPPSQEDREPSVAEETSSASTTSLPPQGGGGGDLIEGVKTIAEAVQTGAAYVGGAFILGIQAVGEGLAIAGNVVVSGTEEIVETTNTALLSIAKAAIPVKEKLEEVMPSQEVVSGAGTLVLAPAVVVVEYSLASSGLLLNLAAFSDLWLLLLRFLYSLLALFGLRAKRRYWGTVYDSQSKQPLDPVVVELVNFETAQVAEQSITDMAGRFGFMDRPGLYLLRARKTHYQFPSSKVTSDTDGIFDHLYHGEMLEIKTSKDMIAPNVPMDPLEFDWNQQDKLRLVKFHPRLEYTIHLLLQALFWGGAVMMLLMFIAKTSLANGLFVAVYILLAVLRGIISRQRLWGRVISPSGKTAGLYLELSPAEIPQVVVGRAVTDNSGRFFLKAQPGRYLLRIKQGQGASAAALLEKGVKVPKSGTLNANIHIA